MSLPTANFTDRTLKVLRIAQEFAAQAGHPMVSPVHVAIGLIREGEGVAAAVLSRRGILHEGLERDLEAGLGPPDASRARVNEVPWSADSVRALEQARNEARAMGHMYVGTEHVLLGLLSDIGREPAELLARYGVRFDDARTDVLDILGGSPA